MFIQTEETPNPSTMKFIPGKDVMGNSGKTIYFKDSAEATNSPLAILLFDIDGVSGVFLGSDFLTITIEDKEWKNIKPSILGVIMNHFVAENPIFVDDESQSEISEKLDDISEKIRDIISNFNIFRNYAIFPTNVKKYIYFESIPNQIQILPQGP